MQDRTPTYPGRVKLVPVDAANGIYDLIRADEPTQSGDPLNKNTFLKDETATLFGMDSTALPDGVFSFLGQFNLHWWKAIPQGGEETYVQSKNRNEYPDFGTQGGVSYLYLGIPFQNSVDAKNTVVDAYSGTGTYGQGNKNSITFSFVPKFLLVIPNKRTITSSTANPISFNSVFMEWIDGVEEETVARDVIEGITYKRFFERVNNTVYWYSTQNADSQMNASGTKYVYFAIG